MMLTKYIQIVHDFLNGLIESIPPHIKEIIQKTSLASIFFFSLLAVAIGINRGRKDVEIKGVQFIKTTEDIFYTNTKKIQNKNKVVLEEDIDTTSLSPEIIKMKQKFKSLSPDTSNRLYGEKSGIQIPEDSLRKKESILLEESDEMVLQRDSQALYHKDTEILKLENKQVENKQELPFLE